MWGAAVVLIAFLAYMVIRSIYDQQVNDSYNKARTESCVKYGLNCR